MKKTAGARRSLIIGCLVWLMATGLPGCMRNQQQHAATAVEPIPEDLQVTFGSGGGFTGMWRGFTISSDGTLYSWEGRAPGENQKAVGKVSAVQLDQLWQRIRQANFFDQEIDQAGNMTTIFRVRANRQEHRVAWPLGNASKTRVSDSLRQLHDFCQQLVEQAGAQQDGR